MASIVQLKRSALSGKVPGTGSLNLGELAVNTYDGKIYFKKSGSIESVESVVTTNSVITGSIRLEGTASFGSLQVNDTLTVNHGISVISGSLGITSDLTVLGSINARQFNISVISSSVLFESGSSKFGNTSDDTHSFTGSVQVTGSVTATSFIGDGSGLTGLTLDSELPVDGWDYDSNSDASINDFNNESTKYIIDFAWNTDLGSPVGYKTFISNLNGSTQLIPSTDGIRFIVGNQQVALVGPNGIESVPPAGTVSGSSQLTSSYDTRYVLSGSITQTTWDNIASKPNGIVSGSSQVIEILTPLNSKTGSYATTGSNLFVGTQTHSGSIIPATDNTYDLGSPTYQWRDIYVSSGSLYIDGTKVLSSTNQELQITTDEGQSIKILEAGSDSIILQSADGDIQLKTSGGGNLLFDPTTGLIDVRGTLQIQDGNKITSSGGNGVVFGNNIVVSGSLESTGNINGINLTTLSSSIASTFLNQNTATSSYETKGRGLVSGSSQITYADVSSIPSGIVSSSAQILNGSGLVSGSSQITYADVSSIPSGIVSGSSQITISSTTGFSTYSTSVDSRITTEKGRVDAILLASDADKDSFAEIVSLINSVDTSNDSTFASFYTASVNRLNNLETTSGSVNISISNINTTTASLNTSVSNLNTATASYETKGRGIVSGSSQITFSGISSLPTLVSGSSQITMASTTGFGTYINQAVLTTSSPTFAGITINSKVTATSAGVDGTFADAFVSQYSSNNSETNAIQTSVSSVATSSGFRFQVSNGGGSSARTTVADFVRSTQTFYGNVLPAANGTQDLGSAGARWSTVYTSDLSLNNGIGDWTIVEGEDDLFLYNNKKGKVYKFALTEVDPNMATPKKS
jgi:hypothetical protein